MSEKINNFIEKYSIVLSTRGYNIKKLEDYYLFQCNEGPAVYIVIAVDMEELDTQGISNLINSYTESLNNNFVSFKTKNIFVVYLMISEIENENAIKIQKNAEPFNGQSIYNIYWVLQLDKSAIINSPLQPSEVGGLAAAVYQTTNGTAIVNHEPEYKVIITYALIALNCLIFFLLRLAGSANNIEVFIAAGAMVPGSLFNSYELHRLFNAMFLHFDLMHLSANCLSLYIFGNITEKYFSRTAFLVIYFVSGFIGNICSLFTLTGVGLGASGAVCGLMGAAIVAGKFAPKFLGFLNTYNLIIMIVVGIGAGFVMVNTNNVAHITGFAAGVLTAYIAHLKKVNKSYFTPKT